MNKNKFALPQNMTTKARNGFNITAVLLVVLVMFDIYSTRNFLTLRTQTQLFAMSLSYVMTAIAFAGVWLSLKNRAETAGWILIAGSIAALFFSNFLGTGLAIIYALTSIVVVFAIANSTLPQKRIGLAVFFSVLGGVAGIIVDTYFPNKAAAGAVPQTFTYVMLFVLMGLLLFVVSRQYGNYSLRTKLLVGGMTLILISVGTLGFVNDYNSRTNLTTSSGTAIKSVADAQAAAIGNVLLQETHVLQSFALSKIVQDSVEQVNSSYGSNQAINISQIKVLDQQWRRADAANNDNDPLVSARLNSEVASELREYRDTFPENVEVFVTDQYGANVAVTNRTSDYYQADEDWWQAAYNNGQGAIYVGQPEYDQSSKFFAIILAVPLYGHGNREVVGVMRTTINIDSILSILNTKVLNGTGQVHLYLPGGQILAPETSEGIRAADPEALKLIPELTGARTYNTFTLDGVPSVVSATQVTSDDPDQKPAVQNLHWILVVSQSEADNLAPIRQQTQSTVVVALIILAIGIALTIFLAQLLSGPIVRLTAVAEQVAAGNNTAQAKVETGDEIGKLASTFNTMTAQLRDFINSLEQRVADRTRNLELAAEVGRAVSQVRNLDDMLKDACELILKEFNLYYVQVYLTNPSQTTLQLEAGTGNVGEQLLARNHSLPLNTGSINGRAAVERRPVVIPDTTQSATFRQNPLLPDTRGEMAIPLIVADKVVGVLDMQSSTPGVLSNEILPAFEALAGQLAVAIQNANLLAETEEARTQVEAQARRLVRQGWNEHMDAIHTPEQLGFVFDHNQVLPLNESSLPEAEHAISTSISVTGESLGSLSVELADESRREQTIELVNIVARQVAQQIENLRLLENAERYRFESERAARLQTVQGWQEYMNSRSNDQLGYLYNLNEVRPSNNGQEHTNALTFPVKVRDEKIGKLSIEGLNSNDTEAAEFVNVVAERLGAHIEGLRQYDQAQSALTQSERLFEASNRLNQSADLQQLVEATVGVLKIPEINRAILVTFNYDPTGAVDSLDVIANWWNGTGHEITPIGTHYSSDVIRVMSMFISSTPVFFNDTLTDERVDATTLQLVKRLNLRAVAVLPLHLGTHQIGALILEAEEPHNFRQDETRLFTALAPQIATVVENRRQFTQAQKQAEREAMLNSINQKIQSATTVEAVLQIAARELGHALGAPMTVAQLSMKDKAS